MAAHGEVGPVSRLQERATRMIFFVGGTGAAAWATLVPFAKSRLGLDESRLGLLLLCLGVGSILAMPVTGLLVSRFGCRKVLGAATALICITLPPLAVIATFPLLAIALFVFGAGLGSADCAFNIQAVMLEAKSEKSLMSGFHGFFSVGGLVGAATASGLLTFGATPLISALVIVAMILAVYSAAFAGLLADGSATGAPLLAFPRGIVLFMGILCFVVFLVEGAMLDWSAVLLTEKRGVLSAQAGFGYACFSLAMTVGRLAGDAVVRNLGPRLILAAGGLLAALGIVLTTLPYWQISLGGFALVGIGCSNIVPVLISAAGRQTAMPQSIAVPALTTMGYAGILAGPAGIGFIARHISLDTTFLLIAALMVGVAIGSRGLKAAPRTAA